MGARVLQFCTQKKIKLRDWQLTLSLKCKVFWFKPSALVLYVIICGRDLGSQVFVNITDLQWGRNGTVG